MEEMDKTVSEFARLNVAQRNLLKYCLPTTQVFEMQLSTSMQLELICYGKADVMAEIGSGLSLHITVVVLQEKAEPISTTTE